MAFISEIHYQNSYANSSGVAEYVEISLSPSDALRAADFDLTTYKLDGTVVDTFNLASITPVVDPVTGLHIYSFDTITTSPDSNASFSAEAIALTDSTLTEPVTFVDIGGGVTEILATEGLASGATSTNIPASSNGTSIQFDNLGNRLDGVLTVGTALCIGNGALIDTSLGPVKIEDLQIGDMVQTRDHGLQPLRWKYSRHVSALDFKVRPSLIPICVKAGSMGLGMPYADLRLSPQHQVLVENPALHLMIDESSCLVKATHLCKHVENVYRDTASTGIDYFHLLFDQHEIIFANGLETESFLPAEEGMNALDPEQIEELEALFPELSMVKPADYVTLREWEVAVAANFISNNS